MRHVFIQFTPNLPCKSSLNHSIYFVVRWKSVKERPWETERKEFQLTLQCHFQQGIDRAQGLVIQGSRFIVILYIPSQINPCLMNQFFVTHLYSKVCVWLKRRWRFEGGGHYITVVGCGPGCRRRPFFVCLFAFYVTCVPFLLYTGLCKTRNRLLRLLRLSFPVLTYL